MTRVDGPVSEFSIAFYSPGIAVSIFFCASLAVSLAAGVWLWRRLHLWRYGVRTEGRVRESLLKISRVKGGEFSTSSKLYTRYLTIEFTDLDGRERTVKGTDYSREENEGSQGVPRVGGKVPVLYSRTNPGNAMYYDPLWHFLAPAACLALGLYLTYVSAGFCYNDIRIMNSLSVSGRTNEEYLDYQNVVIECSDAIYHYPEDAAAYERRGDAQFAMVQYRDAMADYSEALRLRPDRREILLKHAKAAWLDGRNYDALRDWLKSR